MSLLLGREWGKQILVVIYFYFLSNFTTREYLRCTELPIRGIHGPHSTGKSSVLFKLNVRFRKLLRRFATTFTRVFLVTRS